MRQIKMTAVVYHFIVQYGCNPTGMTAALERRREVLALAKKHDFIILEGASLFS